MASMARSLWHLSPICRSFGKPEDIQIRHHYADMAVQADLYRNCPYYELSKDTSKKAVGMRMPMASQNKGLWDLGMPQGARRDATIYQDGRTYPSFSTFKRNCPQAASISCPFSRRRVALTPRASNPSRKFSCTSSSGRFQDNPSTEL